MRVNTIAMRKLAGIGMIVLGVLDFIPQIISIPDSVRTGLILLIAAVALVGGGRNSAGVMVLSLWFLVTGVLLILSTFATISITLLGTIMAIVALLAGILLLIDR